MSHSMGLAMMWYDLYWAHTCNTPNITYSLKHPTLYHLWGPDNISQYCWQELVKSLSIPVLKWVQYGLATLQRAPGGLTCVTCGSLQLWSVMQWMSRWSFIHNPCKAMDYSLGSYAAVDKRHRKKTNRWVSARLQYLHCISNGDTAVLR